MTDENRPDWWSENERMKAEMGLPLYEPPRFEDGTYAYEVIERIEAEHDCRIRLLAVNARYGDDWEVRVDGETAFAVGRRRDDNGNTMYGTTADQFVETVREYFSANAETLG